jgi:hypothetical protein
VAELADGSRLSQWLLYGHVGHRSSLASALRTDDVEMKNLKSKKRTRQPQKGGGAALLMGCRRARLSLHRALLYTTSTSPIIYVFHAAMEHVFTLHL